MDKFKDPLQDIRIGFGEYPVTEVEDVARCCSGLAQDLAGLGLHHRPRCTQNRGVEVALDGLVISHPLAGFSEGNPPVDADNRTSGVGHERKELSGAHPEQDGRHVGMTVAHLGEQSLGGRENQVGIVARTEDARPAVKELERRSSGVKLRTKRGDRHVGQPVDHRLPQGRLGQHE